MIRVPTPVCYGSCAGQAFLVLENLQLGGAGRDVMPMLGRQLAAMHRFTADSFGWQRDNTIGSTHQPNDRHPDWVTFWQEERLGYQLRLAERQGASRRMLNKGEQLLAHVGDFFHNYQPRPPSCTVISGPVIMPSWPAASR